MVADAANGHAGIHGLLPGKVVPELFRRGGVHLFVLLELLQGVLPLLALIQGLLADQLQHRVDGVVRNLLQRPLEDVLGIPEGALKVADGTLGLIDELRGELQIEMLPGLHSVIRELLMVLVRADLCELGNINVRNSMVLDVGVQCIGDGLERGAEVSELPNGVNDGVLDEHHVTDGPDELPAAAAIVLTALPIDLVGSGREAVQVQIPQHVLVHFHLVDMVGGFAQLCEMVLNRFLEFAEFHNFSPFKI